VNELNYTLINTMYNSPVYLATVQACGADGSNCTGTGLAPVCKFLNHGTLIPGANVISTFDPGSIEEIVEAIDAGPSAATTCPKAPYAACVTAPCQLNKGGPTATCRCPLFYGKFQLLGSGAQCSLDGNLVPSASYVPELDEDPAN
jgi:hypothetical protein